MKNEKDEVADYIGGFPEATQVILRRLRAAIREAAPEAEERMSYRMPAYFLEGPLVYFAAYARHVGFYPTASGIEAFEAELSPYKHARGSVQFPLDLPLPYELVARITKFKVEENKNRAQTKREVTAEKKRTGGGGLAPEPRRKTTHKVEKDSAARRGSGKAAK